MTPSSTTLEALDRLIACMSAHGAILHKFEKAMDQHLYDLITEISRLRKD